ncbi:MAG: sodium:solute symporter family protein [Planctomycetota bacterium]
MHPIDIVLLVAYFLAMFGVGAYFLRKNANDDDYYVGGRSMGATHIGLSVVATDVGGGFSIGLGGLGFTMGISGSWMLFTGLMGAWLAAVFLIPTVSRLGTKHKLLTYPQVFGTVYSKRVALVAAGISAIGYLGFTASQLLAGAKLASATIAPLSLTVALFAMGILAVAYTSMGGMKAVIYTDTVQWILLLLGLIFVGLPVAYFKLGGYSEIRASVPASMLRLDSVGTPETSAPVQLINWAFTILPIWFVGMTLYQRIFACRDERTARRAWFLAGLLEWPTMAFLGVVLGLFGRVAFEQGLFTASGFAPGSELDPEYGLPLLLRETLPVGLLGVMLAAYFSAILSTADSCLMAASGNVLTDLLPRSRARWRAQIVTLVIGAAALFLASRMENVLELMLLSYAFMVSGLLVPTIALLVLKKPSSRAALGAMFVGGGTTILLTVQEIELWEDLDPNIFGMTAALVTFIVLHLTDRPAEPEWQPRPNDAKVEPMYEGLGVE